MTMSHDYMYTVPTWKSVIHMANESDAVESYDVLYAQDGKVNGLGIEWCDGTCETIREPNQAINSIRAMGVS